MPHFNPTDERDNTPRGPWLLGVVVCVCVLGLITLAAATLLVEENPGAGVVYIPARPLEQMLFTSHDELIMLFIALAVIIEIVANFGYIKRIQDNFLLLCGFVAFVLGASFTVAESFIFKEVLNYLEHLSYMASALILALWCGRVFGAKKQEGS